MPTRQQEFVHHHSMDNSFMESTFRFHLQQHSSFTSKPYPKLGQIQHPHIQMLRLHCSLQRIFPGTFASAPPSDSSVHKAAVSSPSSSTLKFHVLRPFQDPSFSSSANTWHRHLATSSSHKCHHPDTKYSKSLVETKSEIELIRNQH